MAILTPIKIKHPLSVSRDQISGSGLELIKIMFFQVDRYRDTGFDWIAGSSQVIGTQSRLNGLKSLA